VQGCAFRSTPNVADGWFINSNIRELNVRRFIPLMGIPLLFKILPILKPSPTLIHGIQRPSDIFYLLCCICLHTKPAGHPCLGPSSPLSQGSESPAPAALPLQRWQESHHLPDHRMGEQPFLQFRAPLGLRQHPALCGAREKVHRGG
jgi:hypothetical protein